MSPTQITPLPGQPIPSNIRTEAPARLSATGVVVDNDESDDSFTVTTWQDMVGIPLLSPLTTRATFRLKDGFLRNYQPLPEPHTSIAFTGNLLTITNGIAFVAVDDHSFFDIQGNEFDAVDDVQENLPLW